MVPATTPSEEIWGYRWECKCSKVAIKAKPTDAPKCPKCNQQMLHQTRSTPEKP